MMPTCRKPPKYGQVHTHGGRLFVVAGTLRSGHDCRLSDNAGLTAAAVARIAREAAAVNRRRVHWHRTPGGGFMFSYDAPGGVE
jgi:hypothetical protein